MPITNEAQYTTVLPKPSTTFDQSGLGFLRVDHSSEVFLKQKVKEFFSKKIDFTKLLSKKCERKFAVEIEVSFIFHGKTHLSFFLFVSQTKNWF